MLTELQPGNLEGIMLHEIRQSKTYTVGSHLYVEFLRVKLRETE